jgi:DNA-binding CsgD family transcriptional regulator
MTCSVSTILAILEAFGCGAAVASTDGAIHAENASAERILRMIRQGQTLGSAPGHLPRRLLAMLDANAPAPVSMNLASDRPCVARKLSLGEDSATFLLVCVDLNASWLVNSKPLQSVFGLTRCEALVAVELCTGATLRQIAARREIGIGTVRGQLKSIFIKTGTTRQPELVALLAKLACLNEVESLSYHK